MEMMSDAFWEWYHTPCTWQMGLFYFTAGLIGADMVIQKGKKLWQRLSSSGCSKQ